jgi:hypothetical protein
VRPATRGRTRESDAVNVTVRPVRDWMRFQHRTGVSHGGNMARVRWGWNVGKASLAEVRCCWARDPGSYNQRVRLKLMMFFLGRALCLRRCADCHWFMISDLHPKLYFF